jgi:mitochondrial inner membrane protein COX18
MSKKVKNDTKLSRYGTYFFRTLSVALVPIAAFVPSGLSLYWVTSSAFGLLQNLAILSPKLRRSAGIPKVESELEKPYSHLYSKIRERLGMQ